VLLTGAMATIRRSAPGPDIGALGLAVLVFVGCESSSEQVRPWQPQDHDHTQEPGSPGPRAAAAPGASVANAAAAAAAEDNVVLAAWDRHCARCHGAKGRGDGPQGAVMRVPDLTRPTWQAAVTDQQIALAIRQGRGRMPPFALPDATVKGLIRWIRAQRQTTRSSPAGPASPPTKPPGAAQGPASRTKPDPTPAAK
jgi:cytochrome c oxidase cbb3-type subunit 3